MQLQKNNPKVPIRKQTHKNTQYVERMSTNVARFDQVKTTWKRNHVGDEPKSCNMFDQSHSLKCFTYLLDLRGSNYIIHSMSETLVLYLEDLILKIIDCMVARYVWMPKHGLHSVKIWHTKTIHHVKKNEWFTFPSFAKQWHDHSKDLRIGYCFPSCSLKYHSQTALIRTQQTEQGKPSILWGNVKTQRISDATKVLIFQRFPLTLHKFF